MDNERTFTKDEVNKIVEERLKRERRNEGSLSDLKKLLTEFKSKGLISGNSFSELAENLAEKLSGKAIAEESVGEIPSSPTEAGAADMTKTADIPEESGEKSDFAAELEEMKAAHPETDLKALLDSKEFSEFYTAFAAENPGLTLLEIYEAFAKANELKREKVSAGALKRTPSVQSAKDPSEAALTPSQRKLAANGGMSYREYAKLLSEIPERRMR